MNAKNYLKRCENTVPKESLLFFQLILSTAAVSVPFQERLFVLWSFRGKATPRRNMISLSQE